MLKTIVFTILGVLVTVFGLEVLSPTVVDPCENLSLIDIQRPNEILPVFRCIQSVKSGPDASAHIVVLVGDSLWYGETMAKHGNADWEDHTLDKKLAARLGGEAKVINLGMNGLLPREKLQLLRLLKEIGVDTVVVNTGLRSVSADFNSPNEASRVWLKSLELSPSQSYDWDDGSEDILHSVAHRANVWITNQLTFLNTVARWRAKAFRNAPSTLIDDIEGLDRRKARTAQTDIKPIMTPTMQLQARRRYKTATYDTTKSDQAKSLLELAQLADSAFQIIIVYAQENPDEFSKLMDRDVAYSEKRRLADMLVGAKTRGGLVYIPTVEALETDDFLDLVHVNSRGYESYADAIAVHIACCTTPPLTTPKPD